MDTSQTSQHTSASLAVNPELEVDFLKEKLEHFKLVIHKLQDELQTLKIRKEGAETVSKLLQESKQEAVGLKKKIRTYESVIRNLQTRLENHGMSSEITLQEGEQYLPGHSKQMLDNLTRENTRLRNIIRNENGDPEELIRLQRQCQDLQKELEEARSVVLTNQGILRTSDNEKDVTIATLSQELEQVKHELNTRNTLCTTLAEETQSLQNQLKGVAEQCQELARKLQDKGSTNISQEKKRPEDKKQSPEYAALERKLKEVTEMNMRWQTYDKERATHVTQLTQELRELKERQGASAMARDIEIEMNRVLDKARDDVAKVNRELTKTKRELENSNKDRTSLKTEINRLRQRLGNAGGSDAAETIQALKAQIQICTEDFESERKDREKAQNRLSRQESEIEQLRRENEALKRSQVQTATVAGAGYNDPFFHHHGVPGGYGHEGLAARGSSSKPKPNERRNIDKYNVIDGAPSQSDDDDSSRKQRDENDGMRERFLSEQVTKINTSDKNTDENCPSLRTSSISSSGKGVSPPPSHAQRRSETSSPADMTSSTGVSDDDGRKPGDILKCPKCDNEFKSSEHFDLLEHIEECCA